LISNYTNSTTVIQETNENGIIVDVVDTTYQFKTDIQIPKLGLMMVGWGGNNGTTITGGLLANKLKITW
jgi:myo-inositol-1-phosphate synthase